MEWCYSLNWLSMLCGDPLKRRTDRGSHQVTWPTRWMCMRGKKRKRGTICSAHSCSLSLSFALSLTHTHTFSLTHSLSDAFFFSMEAMRRKQVWCFLEAHKGKDMLAFYSSPLVGFEWSQEMHSVAPRVLLATVKLESAGLGSCLLDQMVSQFVRYASWDSRCCSNWLLLIPEIEDLILWSNVFFLFVCFFSLVAVLLYQRDLSVLDSVVEESSSWIRTAALFRTITVWEIWCDSWSWRSDLLKICKLPIRVLSVFTFSAPTSLCHIFAFMPPLCIPHDQYIMRSLETGCMCSVSYVIRTGTIRVQRLLIKPKDACWAAAWASMSTSSAAWSSEQLSGWGSDLACLDQPVCIVSHRKGKWLAYSWSLFQILCKAASNI